MDIHLIDSNTKKIFAIYHIHLSGQNYVPTEAEYFAEAWKCTVDDGLATEGDKMNYEFRTVLA